jgi:4-hydroxy-tetrahydrodipicolinate synthase
MFKPEGIMPALVTPFTHDQRTVDEEKLRFLVNHCINQGIHGLVACGTTGEFTRLTLEKRKRIVKIVVDEANGKFPVIAGTGASSTQQALEDRPDIDDLVESRDLARHPLRYTP